MEEVEVEGEIEESVEAAGLFPAPEEIRDEAEGRARDDREDRDDRRDRRDREETEEQRWDESREDAAAEGRERQAPVEEPSAEAEAPKEEEPAPAKKPRKRATRGRKKAADEPAAEAEPAAEKPAKKPRRASTRGRKKAAEPAEESAAGGESRGAESSTPAAPMAVPVPPVTKTGSTDRHLVGDDEPVMPQPLSRPRSYRDLDAIPDDFD